jgi:hypothetical protein
MDLMDEEIKKRLVFKPVNSCDPLENTVIESIVYESRKCGDCELTIEGPRRIDIQLRRTPITHWSSRCNKCNLHKCPETGKFMYTTVEYHVAMKNFEKRKRAQVAVEVKDSTQPLVGLSKLALETRFKAMVTTGKSEYQIKRLHDKNN